MKCYYCPDQEIALDRPEWKTKLFCKVCSTAYRFDDTLQILQAYYYGREYKGKTYVVYIRLKVGNSNRVIFNLIDQDSKPVIELDYVPNITPHNFLDKLPTLLTFL